MKTQAKLIAVIAVVAISAGVAFGMLQRPQVPQAPFVALSGGSFSTAGLRGRVDLDRRGRIAATYVGEPDWQEFHARIERALDAPA
jgi:hypothetical protein